MHAILRGADLVDGRGGPARRADVEIEGDRIRQVGEIPRANGALEIDLSDEPLEEPPARFRAAARESGYGESAAWILRIGETRPF